MSPFTLTALERSPDELDAELAADLWAASTAGAGYDDVAARWLSRPTLLRRLAAGLARHIPATADRIAAGGPGAAALGAAVSLWTGLPFVSFPAGRDEPTLGELDRGDQVVAVAVSVATAQELVPRLRAHEAVIAAVAVVVADDDHLDQPGGPGRCDRAGEPRTIALVRRKPHGYFPA
ncbi:hypothetical protein AB0M46_38855 [Dactylosporangium sp. NPDC051485]|uniref:hypothetical protein n=1 Tax=Dactylosporangium sp. NPDC051485 TaxID=3154846 RepID=UPI0034201B1B